MATEDHISQAFQDAQEAFRRKLNDSSTYTQILTTRNAADMLKEVSKVQERLAKRGDLRYMGKIRRFIETLSTYSGVVEQFVQVKPEVLALIWGPIKLLILWSAQRREALDKVLQIMEEIELLLPQFQQLTVAFEGRDLIKETLVMFYEDILEFYQVMLEFFLRTRWTFTFEILWPKHKTEVDSVLNNIKKHRDMMMSRVTVTDVIDARHDRKRLLEALKKSSQEEERREFFNLRNRISPESYESKLDYIRNRALENGSNWLFSDDDFVAWLSTSNPDIRWLWLQGKPGAGKTFLFGDAVDYVKENHLALVAFASHDKVSSQTALAVLQSLVFQAAEDDADFRTLLLASSERELYGKTSLVAKLMVSFVRATGPVNIMIDGLDEMEETERQMLLEKLKLISEESEQVQILISSRAEHDISMFLSNPKCKTIRVHERNWRSIQAYVSSRTRKWINERFDDNTRRDIQSQLLPLSAMADGMFLYARIVLDNLEKIAGLEELQKELRALPEDLNHAYERVFKRINNSSPYVRQRCRRVLGWIGSAFTPMTTTELEQALSVAAHPDVPFEDMKPILGTTNFVQICGSIVEVVDGEVRFVHFTVAEYIYSSSIDWYINHLSASRQLLTTLLNFLGSGVLDPDLVDEEIDANILVGKYCLFEYAIYNWPKLFASIEQSSGIPRDVYAALKRLVLNGQNDCFEAISEQEETRYSNASLQRESPQAHQAVCNTFQLRLNEMRFDWTLHDRKFLQSPFDRWINHDPLMTFPMLKRIRDRLEYLIRQPNHLDNIASRNGPRLYKCWYPFCSYNYRGFETEKEQTEHVKNHNRPWKCNVAGCDWKTIGYASKSSLDKHWEKHHVLKPDQFEFVGRNLDNLDKDEAQALLFGLIESDAVRRVQQLLQSPAAKELEDHVFVYARTKAAEKGSLAMTKILTPTSLEYLPNEVVKEALKSDDIEFAKWALEKSSLFKDTKLFKQILGVDSEHIFLHWEEQVGQQPSAFYQYLNKVLNPALFDHAKTRPLHEARIKHILKNFRRDLDKEFLGKSLLRVARRSCSISMAATLLELGAPINYPRHVASEKGMSALQLVTKKSTREAALFTKFLFENGALPFSSPNNPIDMGLGAREIAKWLGETWEELVQRYTKKRSK